MHVSHTYNDHQIIACFINCFETNTKCVILLYFGCVSIKGKNSFKNHKYNTLLLCSLTLPTPVE